MPSSYTSSLRLTLPATGELTGTWGTTVNTGITELLDSAVAGTASISTWGGAGVPYTLSNTDGAADEARKMFIVATGAPGEAKNVICPSVSKLYFFRNDTTGGFALTLKTSGGSGIAVPAGQYRVLYCNGTNVVEAFNALSSLTLGTALAVTSGGTGTTTSTGTGSVVLSNSPALTTPNLGIPSAATLTNATGLPLTTGVTGTLAASNGGTGQSAYTTGDLIYATGATTLAKLGIGSSTNVLTSSGSAPQWTAASSVAIGTATNIAGGTGGSVPYQSGAATTTFLGIGAANTVMTSSGTAPQWSTALTGLTGVSTTTATLSSDLTLTGGTANGVLYLNGSKVATSGSALTFDGSNLGIGTSSPAYKLDVRGGLVVAGNGTIVGGISYSTRPEIGAISNHPVGFITNNTTQMLLDTSGNLGIGTSSPNTKLEIANAATGIPILRLSGFNSADNSQFGVIQFYNEDASQQGPNVAASIKAITAANTDGSGGQLTFSTSTGTGSEGSEAVERARLDASGNLGLGVTPSAWSTSGVLQLPSGGNIAASTGIGISGNAFFNAGWKYMASTSASQYIQSGGAHVFYTAPSGTAGNAISFTQSMTLDASGNLGIGATSIGGNSTNRVVIAEGADTANFVVSKTSAQTGSITAFDIGIWVGSDTNHPLLFKTNGTQKMQLDSSGNLGLGVTPSAWATYKSFELPAEGYISSGNNWMELMQNAYFNGGYKYKGNGFASHYLQQNSAHIWYTAPSGTAGNTISFTQAMTLDASGNLGVGTTSPSYRLDVSYAGTTQARVYANANSTRAYYYAHAKDGSGNPVNAYFVSYGDGGSADIGTSTNHAFAFTTNNTERARITSGGDLLVGNTASVQSSRAEFTSTSLVPAFLARVNVDADENQWAGQFQKKTNTNTTSQIFVRFLINDGATPSGYITANGANAATFTSSSDEKLKENIADLPSQLASIQSLRPVEFDYKDGSGHQIGFIAQELQTVYPDCVSEGADGMLQIGGWSKTEARLVKAIQEQQAIIDSLKARLDSANL